EILGKEKGAAFFVAGFKETILTRLGKFPILREITGTGEWNNGAKGNVRKVGRTLGGSNVLEGTAGRSGGKVHVNAQLVDTRTNTGVWADGYERDLKQAFSIPGEIAQKVAEQMRAKISTTEKAAIERKPTADVTAFELYAQAKNLLLTSFSSAARAKLLEAANLLDQAITHDPSFFEAYCELVHTHGLLYF